VRFFIEISYNGKNYHGWQIQENASTIQEEIDNAISLLLKKKIKTIGSGRTDTGVHAISQVAHFDYDKPIDNSFLYRINSFLSSDISINSIKKVFPHSARLQHFQIHAVTEGTDAQATVSVRLEEAGKIVTGQSSDTDTVVASAKAYINSLNKLVLRRQKKAPKAIAN